MTTTCRAGSRPGLATHATRLTTAVRADGRHDHVTVSVARGFLYVEVDEQPILRLEPGFRDQYRLSFHHHTGRWAPTPFIGDVAQLATVITTAFEPYLESYDFPPTKSGSDH